MHLIRLVVCLIKDHQYYISIISCQNCYLIIIEELSVLIMNLLS